MVTETRTVETAGGIVTYLLTVKQVKNLNLRVRADGAVLLSVGRRTTRAEADAFVKSRGAWILGHLSTLEQRGERPHLSEYVQGERFTLRGEETALWALPGEDREARKRALGRQIDKLCRAEFQAALDRVFPLVEGAGVKRPELRVRRMSSRWGSCHYRKGVVVLNTALIAVPVPCLDYVALHELVHFLHPNHGAGFYAAMSARMPDWKARRKTLQEFGGMLHTL